MSREKPILFNTDMVKAILDGKKTVTRRPVKPKYKEDEYGFLVYTNMGTERKWVEKTNEEGEAFENPRYIKPYYNTGDILYVRETWFYEPHMENITQGEPDLPSGRYSHRYIYRADNPEYPVNIGVGANGWRPSIHMPKEAARIWLKVTDVRVEMLQDITEEQAEKEGCDDYTSTALGFFHIWDSTIKKADLDKYGWDANPWVWVIDFERCEKPEEN